MVASSARVGGPLGLLQGGFSGGKVVLAGTVVPVRVTRGQRRTYKEANNPCRLPILTHRSSLNHSPRDIIMVRRLPRAAISAAGMTLLLEWVEERLVPAHNGWLRSLLRASSPESVTEEGCEAPRSAPRPVL